MEDVYFERIAGVGERKDEGAGPRQPQGATPVVHSGPPVLNMALDTLDEEVSEVATAVEETPVVRSDVPCDENGFPVSPLRDQEDLWFVQAAALYKPLSKCVSTARSSGMFLLISGLLSVVVGALSADVVTVVVGLIVATLGTMERGAANDLAQAKASAPFRLAVNQILLLALIVTSSWMTLQSVEAEAAQAMAVAADDMAEVPVAMQGMVQQMTEMGPDLLHGLFIVIVVTSLVFQGGLALYYFTRRRKVHDFHAELPPWVSEIVTTVAMR